MVERRLMLITTLFVCSVAGRLLAAAPATTGPTTGPLAYTPLPTTPPAGAGVEPVVTVAPISDALRQNYRLDSFYTKMASIHGIPIIGSEHVSDYAFLECAYTLDHLLSGRTMALDALTRARVRVGIIAVTEYTMDIPENQRMGNGAYNDRRSRGLGGLPLATCAEENLLNLRGDPYTAENITIHEFSHTVASAIRRVNPAWWNKLTDAYNKAMVAGNYGTSYAATDAQEYWAEGAQCWFNCANPRNAGGAGNRDQLKAKDPVLADLLTEVYGDGEWRYFKTTNPNRSAADLAHLSGLDRNRMPVFNFNNSTRIMAAATQPGQQGPNARGGRGGTRGSAGSTTRGTPSTTRGGN
jgi:hypothetical protein